MNVDGGLKLLDYIWFDLVSRRKKVKKGVEGLRAILIKGLRTIKVVLSQV